MITNTVYFRRIFPNQDSLDKKVNNAIITTQDRLWTHRIGQHYDFS